MKINKRAATAVVAAISAVLLPAMAGSAGADSSVAPWEATDTNALGSLTLYNAAGDVVTGGSDLTHLFDYAQADTADPDTGAKATLFFALPTPNEDPGDWPVGQASTSAYTPPTATGTPTALTTSADPVSTSGSSGANLETFITGHETNSQAGYENVYQVRVETSGGTGGGTAGSSQYWTADVQVDPSAGTWEEIYPETGSASVTTTTTLTADPASAAQQGSSVMLTAAVAATGSSTIPAGTVEFDQDGLSVGTADVDTTATDPAYGTAVLTTSTLAPSAPSGTTLTATFTPSNTSDYSPSTSSNLTYTVNPTAKTPTISGAHKVGTTESCSESNTAFGVTSKYAWLVNGSQVATTQSYKIPGSAYNKSLACKVSVSDGGGTASTATSSSVKVAEGAALKDTKKPAISGTAKVGKTLKVSKGTWSPAASSYSYQWLLNGKAIKGATKSSFKLVKADGGKKISCKVTAKATGYASGSATTSSKTVSK